MMEKMNKLRQLTLLHYYIECIKIGLNEKQDIVENKIKLFPKDKTNFIDKKY